jgi:hypothetical protein
MQNAQMVMMVLRTHAHVKRDIQASLVKQVTINLTLASCNDQNTSYFHLNLKKALPCDLSPSLCLNGGSCTNKDNGEFSCECKSGYTGTNCETRIKN